MVLSVVFLTFALLIQYAYVAHDKITGTMILEESVIKARSYQRKDPGEVYFEEQGKEQGDPRLWLGRYDLDIKSDEKLVAGTASAGEWKQELEMSAYRPGRFLRQLERMKELTGEEEDLDHGENRIQEGDEPKLYGTSPTAGLE